MPTAVSPEPKPAAPDASARLDPQPVSVILYVHNGLPYLQGAIDSVLSQTHSALELCVVDDGSTDATPTVLAEVAARDPRVRVERQEAHGRSRLHETVNAAFAMTQFDLIAIANADDIWRADKLQRQVAEFASDPTLDVCHHEAVFIDEVGRVRHGEFRSVPSPHLHRDVRPWHFVVANPIPNPTVVFHRSILRRVGLQEVGDVHDHQFWFKAAVHGCSFLGLPDRLIRYRIHEASHSTASDRKPAILKAAGDCVAMMLERYSVDQVVPELLAVDSTDPANRAWAFCHIGSLMWPRHADQAAEYFRAALGEVDNPAVRAALGMALLHGGDGYQALSLLRDAAAAGVPQARLALDRPDHCAAASVPLWHGAEPPVAALVRSREPVVEPLGRQTSEVADVALVIGRGGRSSVVIGESMGELFEERGSVPSSVVVVVDGPELVDAVVEGYQRASVTVPGLAEELSVEIQVAWPGELGSIAMAHLMEGTEVRECGAFAGRGGEPVSSRRAPVLAG